MESVEDSNSFAFNDVDICSEDDNFRHGRGKVAIKKPHSYNNTCCINLRLMFYLQALVWTPLSHLIGKCPHDIIAYADNYQQRNMVLQLNNDFSFFFHHNEI